jgi:adenylate cyclase class 2
MIEVEVKAKITDFEEIKQKLKEIGAIKFNEEFQEDTYFERNDIQFAKNDKALRIRKIIKNNLQNSYLTYKGSKLDKSTKTREEIELKIENGNKMLLVLERLNFYKGGFVKKHRQNFKLNEYIISLDDVEGLDPYMEIEIAMEDGEDYHKGIDKIYEIFKELAIESGFERRSYLELIQLKN